MTKKKIPRENKTNPVAKYCRKFNKGGFHTSCKYSRLKKHKDSEPYAFFMK